MSEIAEFKSKEEMFNYLVANNFSKEAALEVIVDTYAGAW